jgi:hypothetical protein
MQDADLLPGQRVIRPGGQLVACGLFSCGQNLDGECYAQVVQIGQVIGLNAPVCMSYVGVMLEEL